MKNFNLSNPATKKVTEKKVKWYEKIWAFLNLIALMGDGIVPKGAKDAIPLKVRNVIIIFLMGILAYFLCTGVWYNSMLLIEAAKGVSFSFGDGFYYYGIVAIISLAMGYFTLEDTLSKHKNIKQIIAGQMKSMKKSPKEIISNAAQQSKGLARALSFSGFVNGLWVIWGIIFYDRWWFVTLLSISLIFSIISSAMKKVEYVRWIMILEMIFSIIMVLLILNNHFLIF